MVQPLDKLQAALDDGMAPPPGVLSSVPDVGFEIPDAFVDDETAAGETADVIVAAMRWAPTDADGAEWAMSMLVEYTGIVDGATDQAAQWHRRIDAWLAKETREAEFWRVHFDQMVRRYAVATRIESGDKVKTLRLPSGTVPTTATAEDPLRRVKITDADGLLAWATDEELDEIVQITRKVLVTDLRTAIEVADRVVFRDGEPLLDASIVDSYDDETDETTTFATQTFADGPVILEDVEIVDGPFVIHRDSGMIVPGVEVEPRKITANDPKLG